MLFRTRTLGLGGRLMSVAACGLGLVSAQTAVADAIPLATHSFESPFAPIILDPESTDPFATVEDDIDGFGWFTTGPIRDRFGRVGKLDTGIFLNTATPIDETTTIPPIPNALGSQLAFIQVNSEANGSATDKPFNSIWQETATLFEADTNYDFTLAIGTGQLFPASADAALLLEIGYLTPGGDFEFIAQRRIFASQLDNSGAGFLTDFTVFADPGEVAPALGNEIAVRIQQRGGTDGGGFNIDNARLASAPVPEPTSLALMGLGGLLVARRRRA